MPANTPAIRVVVPEQATRVAWIDVLRFVACVAVVFIHVTGLAYSRFSAAPWWEWWLANIMSASSRASVPVFMMISGALMKERDCDVLGFYRKKAIRFLPVILVWTVIYGAFDLIVMGYNFKGLLLELVSHGNAYTHLWYLTMLAFIFALAPYLAKFKFSVPCSPTEWRMLVGLGVVFVVIEWVCHFASRALGGAFDGWTKTFVAFVPYFFLGIWLSTTPITTTKRPRYVAGLCAALIVSWVTNYLSCRFLGIVDDSLPLSSQSPMVLAVAVSVFLVARSSPRASLYAPRWLSIVGEASLGIYLIHPILIWFFNRLLRGSGIDLLIGLWILPTAILAFGSSLGCILLLRKFPLGRKIC